MRKISDLIKDREKVWIYLDSEELAKEFVKQAASEGFIHSNGNAPDPDNVGYVYAIHQDMSIAHLAICMWVMSFEYQMKNPPLRVDYRKYIYGENEFECEKAHITKVD